ncbi:MBL fold metallo-hydrolase [Solirubrobacter phytolaccae]|uniref:MBL fold metallo-hydrolase n=1 Tax=Solirubrobacter phytolaccae TaxID=1404360 RepID=A0A9X3NEU5_9ACTN|nr:MBL fold metallo-hydrolase [Solirubrobacter phytolaccae]MDA0184741.1 MBL fold metallo-hydrolase [Solirubrobacter phytolaccae]
MTWLGHATVLIEVGGVRLLTDPVLSDRVMHLKRQVPVPERPRDIDAVLISHLHHDHLHKPSLRGLAATALAPVGASKYLADYAVHEVRPGDTVDVGVTVEAVPAWHDGRRRPGPGAEELDTLGYLVDGVWFAGDTDYDPAMEALRGRVDCALIPIWGWGPSLGPGHLDPAGAARVIDLIAPRLAVPIHWGTFLPLGLGRRHERLLTDPPLEFSAAVAGGTRVEVVAPGGSVEL